MQTLLYWFVRALVGVLQALPLPFVARVGRIGGTMFYWLDARHRRVALGNLRLCFGARKSPVEIRMLARENFGRIGENFCTAIKTASMTAGELRPFCEVIGEEKLQPANSGEALPRWITAIGHFGNFELYARAKDYFPGFIGVTTYRGLRQPLLDRLMKDLRTRSGCLFFERRSEAAQLKAIMRQPGVILGLLADQHAGDSGLRLPFLGHECSTSAAPAVFALRYRCRLITAICRRVSSAHWRIEVGNEIATHLGDQARPVAEIMLDVNRAFETEVLRDPANWFWVHRRWKPAPTRRPRPAPAIAAIADEPGD